MRPLGTEQRQFLADATLTYQQALEQDQSASSADAREYLNGRRFGDRNRQRYQLGFVADPMPGHEMMAGRISIPYLTPAGPVDIKFRCIAPHVCKDVKCPKYLASDGGGQWLYNARAILATDDKVAVCEGELDAAAVSCMAGVPAVGYPGADTWVRQKHWPRVLAGLEAIIVADGDTAGVKAAKAVAETLDNARIVRLPEGEDANSLIVKEGPEAFRGRLGVE